MNYPIHKEKKSYRWSFGFHPFGIYTHTTLKYSSSFYVVFSEFYREILRIPVKAKRNEFFQSLALNQYYKDNSSSVGNDAQKMYSLLINGCAYYGQIDKVQLSHLQKNRCSLFTQLTPQDTQAFIMLLRLSVHSLYKSPPSSYPLTPYDNEISLLRAFHNSKIVGNELFISHKNLDYVLNYT